jgi:CIC family chloride channel protein
VGIAGGVLAALFIKTVGRLRGRLERLPHWTRYVQPLLAGLAVGVAGLWLPQVMGAGYEAIDSALHDEFVWQMLLLLAATKIVVTLLCFSAGTPGGMFAPTLFIGAMLGGGMGGLVHHFVPAATSPASAYVLVGMGTFFAGVFRAPMTAIFMVFEVTASYGIILPVAIAGTLAYFVSRALQRVPFFTMLAAQEGFDLPSAEEQRRISVMHIEDVMAPPPPVLDSGMTVAEAAAALDASDAAIGLAGAGGSWEMILRTDLDGSAPDRTLASVKRRPVPKLYPDLPVDAALRLLGAHPLVVVAHRADPDRLAGTVTLTDIQRGYGIGGRPAASS